MTREDYIKKAEKLVNGVLEDGCYWRKPTPEQVARAQVYATLALAAAPSEQARPQPDTELVAAVEAIRSEVPKHWWSRVTSR